MLQTDLTVAFQYLKWAHRKGGEGLFIREHSHRMSGNGFKLKESTFRLYIRKKFFTVRAVRQWNRLPREAVDALSLEVAKPLSIIYQQSWLTREVPDDWRISNATPIYKKGQMEDPRNYRPVRLTLVLGKVMEWFIWSVLPGHMKDNQGIRPS